MPAQLTCLLLLSGLDGTLGQPLAKEISGSLALVLDGCGRRRTGAHGRGKRLETSLRDNGSGGEEGLADRPRAEGGILKHALGL